MDYRLNCAENEEQREKEKNFYGIGLTSRKNLCIHPEVSMHSKCRPAWTSLCSLLSERRVDTCP